MSSVTATEVAQDLETFVRERFQVEEDDDLFSPDVNLWEEGYVDSAGVVELIAYLEDTYAIQIPRAMLFDLERDPGEQVNLIDELPELASRFQARVEELRSALEAAALERGTAVHDQSTIDRLRELGY